MTETPIDRAHAAMTAAPEDDAKRLTFYEHLAIAELFLLLEGETTVGDVSAATFDTSDGPFVLAFDTEERLADFTKSPAPYAALSGRAIAAMLAGQGIGMAINPEVAASAILIPPEAVDWLNVTLAEEPVETTARPVEVAPPGDLPDRLLESLDARLATAAGLATSAYLANVAYADGTRTRLLAIIDPAPGAEATLARAVSEALIFSDLDGGVLDVAFFTAMDDVTGRLARVGLKIDLPEIVPPTPPSRDPNDPPRLR